jgi:hypothetical protein
MGKGKVRSGLRFLSQAFGKNVQARNMKGLEKSRPIKKRWKTTRKNSVPHISEEREFRIKTTAM